MSEFEKKSERIEIRVSHPKKQAFHEACDSQGDTPSNALRRFIDGYIRRADQDMFKDGLRAVFWGARRQWVPLTMSVAVLGSLLLIGGYYTGKALRGPAHDGPIVTASKDEFPPINYALFAAYDKNANGVLDLGEVADNDEHLHRVLNLDGKAGIAPAEFYVKGNMVWNYIKKGSTQIGQDEHGPTVMTKQIHGETARNVHFDLTDASAPSIRVSTPPAGTPINPKDIREEFKPLLLRKLPKNVKEISVHTAHPDRSVSWERGQSVPAMSFSNHGYRVRGTPPHIIR